MAFGRIKNGRHRPPADEAAVQQDTELESYLAALAPESDLETTATGSRFGGAGVYQLRLPINANEQLHSLAEELETSPRELLQDWLLQRLAWEARQQEQRWIPAPQATLQGSL
ncbi:hypothetical protein FHR81_003587 [Actinoalloteichus hoggarensis]|uniref:hypothetical protein n=1 Tax=Actinoalloteichus hoggarensis TaxID=1470176 RepID=UPI0017B8E5C9|nr:hypothetical protein [Actinoalloteichus hoggarensis]MBB5922530.1 hypothetical protein [Actinoalloteichus hoggarensis]